MENKHTGFRLSSDKTGKDRGKAAYANAYIGFGVAHRRSSTGIYLDDAVAQGIPVNERIIPDASTVAFVSVASEGTHNERTIFLARKVIRMGGTLIMDAPGTGFGRAHSSYNRHGEGKVQEGLGTPAGYTREGYSVFGNMDNIYRP